MLNREASTILKKKTNKKWEKFGPKGRVRSMKIGHNFKYQKSKILTFRYCKNIP